MVRGWGKEVNYLCDACVDELTPKKTAEMKTNLGCALVISGDRYRIHSSRYVLSVRSTSREGAIRLTETSLMGSSG